jgi:hypothetical protein
MARTLILALAATGLLYGAGVAAPAPIAGDPTTTSLSCPTSLVFLGIEGDYKAVTADELHTWLTEEQKQVVFGKDLRALSDPTRRVWALETADAKKLHRSLKSKLQKKGFKATLLQATAVEPLEEDRRAVNSACREVEREDKVWTMWTSRRTPRIWVFHEPKLSGKKVEGLFRKTKSSVAYAHTEVSLTLPARLRPPAGPAPGRHRQDRPVPARAPEGGARGRRPGAVEGDPRQRGLPLPRLKTARKSHDGARLRAYRGRWRWRPPPPRHRRSRVTPAPCRVRCP